MTLSRSLLALCAGIAAGLPAIAQAAPIDYTVGGFVYAQKFDTLTTSTIAVSWSDGVSVPGWHFRNSTNVAPNYQLAADGTVGRVGIDYVISAGASSKSDRALSASTNFNQQCQYGAGFANKTGGVLRSFDLSYSGEQWRVVTGDSHETVQFQYQIFPAGSGSIAATGGWTAVSTLSFSSKVASGESRAIDGNVAGKSSVSGSVSGLTWNANQELWIRWVDSGSARHMLGIDDVQFSAIPEPTSLAMIGLASLLLGRRRRR